jgi:mRNA interferase MazF
VAALPDVGDIAWAELDPVKGSEQAGRRPALVLTGAEYHRRSPRALVCPISSRARPWAFNVPLPDGLKVQGMILVDQLRMIDRAERLFDVIEAVSPETLAQVRGLLATLAGLRLGA